MDTPTYSSCYSSRQAKEETNLMESSENDPAFDQFLTCKCNRVPLKQISEKPESRGKVLLRCENCDYQEWE
ncbi:10277_t:CDS:2, partial [Acaulospora morrowiae]